MTDSMSPQTYGMNLSIRSILSPYIGEGAAAKWAYENPLCAGYTFQAPNGAYENPFDSIFKSPAVTSGNLTDSSSANSDLGNLLDLNATGSNPENSPVTTSGSENGTVGISVAPDGTTTITTPKPDGTTEIMTVKPDGTTTTETKPTTGAAAKAPTTSANGSGKTQSGLQASANSRYSGTSDLNSFLNSMLSSTQQSNGNYGGYNSSATMFGQFMDMMMGLMEMMFQGFNSDSTSALSGSTSKHKASNLDCTCNAANIDKSPEEVAEMRQERVDTILEKNGTQRKFEKLATKLESDNKKDINNTLQDLTKLSDAEFAAFKQYLEGQNKNLEEILEDAEKIDGVSETKIDKTFAKMDTAQAWLEAYDIEQALYLNEANAEKDEVAEIRQEKVEKFLETNTAQRQFGKLANLLTVTDTAEIDQGLKDLKKLSAEELAIFKQYLENHGTSLDEILDKAKANGADENVIEKIKDKDADAKDWLEANDIDE